MEFNAETSDGVCEAVVEGELTIYHVGEFKKELEKTIKKASSINLNLANVSEIDTSCFQLLMQAYDSCLESGKAFKLSAVSQPIEEVMEIFGLERHFGELNDVATN